MKTHVRILVENKEKLKRIKKTWTKNDTHLCEKIPSYQTVISQLLYQMPRSLMMPVSKRTKNNKWTSIRLNAEVMDYLELIQQCNKEAKSKILEAAIEYEMSGWID